MKTDLSLQNMLNEIKVIADADLRRLKGIFGDTIIQSREKLQVDDLPITAQMRVLFDYVVNVRLPRNYDLGDALHDVTDYFLETVPRSPLIDLYCMEPIEGICAWVVDTAVARWGLDFEEIGAFTIKQLATLANMDERSVRNAANPKNANPLVTSRGADGATMVARDDAIAWLTGRRSYRPTTFYDESGERDLEQDGFRDLQDLARYVQTECEKQGKPLDRIIECAGLQCELTNWLAGADNGNFSFDADRFKRLAAVLHKDERIFTLAACKVWQKAELASLDIKLRS